MIDWGAIATALLALACAAGWGAWAWYYLSGRAQLDKLRREAQRTHEYWENMRRVYRRD